MTNPFLMELGKSVLLIQIRIHEQFTSLSEEQLNWSPQADVWSIGQCFDHLRKSNEPYFEIFAAVADKSKREMFWERLPILPAIWGKLVLDTVRPDTKRKSKAPRGFRPALERVPEQVVVDLHEQQRRLVEAIRRLDGIDLGATVVTSPVARFITYSLRDALAIVVAHEERHMNQAERVLGLVQSS